jgi:leucine dehydrogenase
MELFETLTEMGHEEVVFLHDEASGLKAIVAIHSTVLGPALGGLRMWPYASEEEALTDVLRLSRGMTYKAAVSGLNLGGGKAVLIGNPEVDKSEALFRNLGRHIDGLGGRYITAEDVNTSVSDMEYVLMETDFVVGVPEVHGGGGDPSPFTAYGTLRGIEACLMRKYGSTEISDKAFSVQGVGHVGGHLVRMLRERGGKVFVTDINQDRVQQMVDDHGAESVPMDEIYDVDANVYAPCALGATINESTVPRLKCDIVAGAANNQLETTDWGTALEERGIVYAPDYAINAGGLMNVAVELQGYDQERAYRMVKGVYDNIERIFRIAERDSIPSWQAADRLAEERVASVGAVRSKFNRGQKSMLGDRGLNL